MKAKWVLPALTGLVLVANVLIFVGQGSRVVSETGVPKGWTFTLADGDAKAGRSTFIELRCYMCHNVSLPGDDFPESKPGIGRNLRVIFAGLPKEYVAQCLLNVHTVVPDPCYDVQNEQPGVESARHYLTVQELTDLAAFLKQKPEGSAKN